jgi:hypothetical protein
MRFKDYLGESINDDIKEYILGWIESNKEMAYMGEPKYVSLGPRFQYFVAGDAAHIIFESLLGDGFDEDEREPAVLRSVDRNIAVTFSRAENGKYVGLIHDNQDIIDCKFRQVQINVMLDSKAVFTVTHQGAKKATRDFSKSHAAAGQVLNKFRKPKLDEDAGIVDFPIANVKRKNGAIGTQGVSSTQVAGVLINVCKMGVDPKADMRTLVDEFKRDKSAQANLLAFMKKHPAKVIKLPDDSYHLQDGHHRIFLLDQAGYKTIPAVVS